VNCDSFLERVNTDLKGYLLRPAKAHCEFMAGPKQPEQLKSKNEKPMFDCDKVQQLKQMTKRNTKGMCRKS